MGRKNLLSDTDYNTGKDNRFGSSVVMGRVTKIECDETQANVRVIFPDKVDHKGTPLITKPVPVLHPAATGKKSFQIPRVGTNVALLKYPNSHSDYAVLGSFYTTSDPPPVTDPKLDYTEWEGGHIQKFDANDDAEVFMTQDFKGGIDTKAKKNIKVSTTDGAHINLEADGDVNVKAPNGAINLQQKNILLEGAVTIKGDIEHTGNMRTSGVHQDSNGLHTSGRSAEELEKRVVALEHRVTQLEALLIAIQREKSNGS
jgi:phage baseplate assembly protein gpV